MISTASTTDLIAAAERARADLLRTVTGLSESDAAFKPSPDEWSIVENIEHLYLAEISVISKVWTALEAVRAGAEWTDALPNAGRSVEDIISATWKPKEIAPPIATPHIGGPLSLWRSAYSSLTPLLRDLGDAIGGRDLETIVFPHFLSGAMDARQRLEFVRFHIERHHAQIERVMTGRVGQQRSVLATAPSNLIGS